MVVSRTDRVRLQMKRNTRKVYLRALTNSDLDRVLEWHNDAGLYASLGGHFRYVSREAESEWFRRRLEARDEVNLAICLSDPPAHVGNAYLRDFDWVARHAELHIFIGEPGHRGKGYGFSAMQLLMRHAFCDLGLRRLHLRVLEDNESAIHLYNKCGFRAEGMLRSHAFKDGHWRNLVIMGICDGDLPTTHEQPK
jgi:RimJ/RimL family protein N-acetyltransferase